MAITSTISDLIRKGESLLQGVSETPYLDSEILFCKASGLSRIQCISKSQEIVADETRNHFHTLVERRLAKEPIAYITGVKEFWSLVFDVTPAVLIPRPETELIVEEALRAAEILNTNDLCIVDIGTGSGCIAVSIAHELQRSGRSVKIIATDISSDAITVASKNAKLHGVEKLISFQCGSLFDPILDLKGKIDILVSNPPYISLGDTRVDPGTVFEPQNALYAEDNGLSLIHTLVSEMPRYISPTGIFLFEFGAGQEKEIANRFFSKLSSQYNWSFIKDHAELYRIGKVEKLLS